MARRATAKKEEKWDEMWCLIRLPISQEAMVKQCDHADAKGRYVVKAQGSWCCFDPPTKMQANIWVNDRQERRERVMWQCFECGEIMPLGSYEG